MTRLVADVGSQGQSVCLLRTVSLGTVRLLLRRGKVYLVLEGRSC
jgi:hypothetical protein